MRRCIRRNVRIKAFVRKLNAVQRDGGDLIVTYRKPGRSRTSHQEAVHARRMNQRHDRRICTGRFGLLQIENGRPASSVKNRNS